MGKFHYRILDKSGKVEEGVVGGRGKVEAKRQLVGKGYQILSLEEKDGDSKDETPTEKSDGVPPLPATKQGRTVRLSTKHLIHFTEELGDLLSAGIQLDASLQSLADRSGNEGLREVSRHCYEKVRDGVPLASALRSSSGSFSDLYCSLVSAGEVSGALSDILNRQAVYLTTLQELRGRLLTAMIYPAFLILSGVGVTIMFSVFLLPRLERLVTSTGGELTLAADLILRTSRGIEKYWPVLLLGALTLAIIVYAASRKPSVRIWWDRISLKLPVVGPILKSRFNVQFVETLSNLLVNGLPLVQALGLVQTATGNRYLQGVVTDLSDKVTDGGLLFRAMESTGVFEAGLVDMVRIGEESGRLAPSLLKGGDRIDRDFKRKVENMGALVQPVIILLMAGLVGTMAYLMISVIYDTISILRTR